MDAGCQPPEMAQEVALDPAATTRGRRPPEAHHLDRRELRPADRPGHDVTRQDLDARITNRRRERAIGELSSVDHRSDGDACGGQIERAPIAVVAGREDHRTSARRDGKLVDVASDGARQHHARPVVAREHERALDRTGRQHHLACPDRPEPLARAEGIG